MSPDTRLVILDNNQKVRSTFCSSDSRQGYGLFLTHEHDLNSNDDPFSESSGYFESLLDTWVCQSVFYPPAFWKNTTAKPPKQEGAW